jgi:hypothetical protein
MDWSSLLTLAVIGLMFFLLMRHGGESWTSSSPICRGKSQIVLKEN